MRAPRVFLISLLPALFTELVAAAATASLPSNPDGDPLALDDPFLKLSEAQLRALWSQNEEVAASTNAAESAAGFARSRTIKTLAERLAALNTLSDVTYVDVRLVGFAGDGDHEVVLREDDLQRLLDAASQDAPVHVVQPRGEGPSAALPVARRLLYSVKAAPPSLASRISRAIASHAEASAVPGADAASVPLSAVDSLIREDYARQRGSHATLYLLNPRAPRRQPTADEVQATRALAARAYQSAAEEKGGDPAAAAAAEGVAAAAEGVAAAAEGAEGEAQPAWWHRLRYSYDPAGDGAAEPAACPTTKWVGASERYMWVDLSAGPVAYGPRRPDSGLEVVTAHRMPSALGLAARFATAGGGADAEAESQRELALNLGVEVAALAVASSETLLAPPPRWLPDHFHTALTVVILEVRVGKAGAAKGGASVSELGAQLLGRIEPLAAAGQRVSVESAETSLEECAACAAAYAAASRAREAAANGTAAAASRSYLDASALGDALRAATAQLPHLRDRGVVDDERVVPIFLFTIHTAEPAGEALDGEGEGRGSGLASLPLLDAAEQAVAFHDLALVVRSAGGGGGGGGGEAAAHPTARPGRAVPLDAHCAGATLHLDPSDATRPLLGAALSSVWGVSPSHIRWSSAHGHVERDVLWAVGPTPYGPYSNASELSFALRDAAARSALHAVGAEALDELRLLSRRYDEFGKTVDEVLRPAERLPFLRRLNVLSYKLRRAASYLATHNWRHAQYHLHSTRHDLRAMRAVLDAAEGTRSLVASPACE